LSKRTIIILLCPFRAQQTEGEQVPSATITQDGFAAADFFDEAELADQRNRCLAIFRYDDRHTEQVQLGEGEAQQQTEGLRPETMTTILARANAQAQVTVTVGPVDPFQDGLAQQTVVLAGADGEVEQVLAGGRV
jgi:hypothetical protein